MRSFLSFLATISVSILLGCGGTPEPEEETGDPTEMTEEEEAVEMELSSDADQESE